MATQERKAADDQRVHVGEEHQHGRKYQKRIEQIIYNPSFSSILGMDLAALL
jgi:hypothetical protein